MVVVSAVLAQEARFPHEAAHSGGGQTEEAAESKLLRLDQGHDRAQWGPGPHGG